MVTRTRVRVHVQALSSRLPSISSRSCGAQRTAWSRGTSCSKVRPRSACSRPSARNSPSTAGANRRAQSGRGAGRDDAVLRQVVIDLSRHPRNLGTERRRECRVVVRDAIGIPREQGQRRLQAMRHVCGALGGASHARVACLQQRVQIVHERLDLRRVRACQSRMRAAVHVSQPHAQEIDGADPAPEGERTRRHAAHPDGRTHRQGHGDEPVEDRVVRLRVAGQEEHGCDGDDEHHAERPQHRSGEEPRAERARGAHGPGA